AMTSDLSAPSIALPCGSRMPDLRVTVMRAFIACPARIDMARTRESASRQHNPDFVALNPGHTTLRSPLDQDRPHAARPLALAHNAEAFGDLGVGLNQPPEIAAEAVLVELFVRLDVPQPARIGGELVRHHDAHEIVLPEPAGLHFEIDETDTDAEEQAG